MKLNSLWVLVFIIVAFAAVVFFVTDDATKIILLAVLALVGVLGLITGQKKGRRR